MDTGSRPDCDRGLLQLDPCHSRVWPLDVSTRQTAKQGAAWTAKGPALGEVGAHNSWKAWGTPESESKWSRAGQSGFRGPGPTVQWAAEGTTEARPAQKPPVLSLISVRIISFIHSFIHSSIHCLMSSCSGPETEDSRVADRPEPLSS